MRIILLCLSAFIFGCSIDGSIGELVPTTGPVPIEKLNANSDFVTGEVVTTDNGVVVKASFGEVSEKQTLGNGIQIEGAFYQ